MAKVTHMIAKKLRARLSQKINKLPFGYYDKTPVGDVLSRITNDVDVVSQTMGQSIVTALFSVVLIVGSAIWMFTISWILALVAIGVSLIGFVIMGLVMSKSMPYYNSVRTDLGDLNAHVEEYYGGHTVVKASNANDNVEDEFEKLNNNLYKSNWKSNFFGSMIWPLMDFVSQFAFIAVCIVGGVLAFNGSISFPAIALFLIYVRLFTYPIMEVASSATQIQATAAASHRVFEFLEEDEMEDESALTKNLDTVKGDIRFENVKFGYSDDKLVIKDFSADIKAGSKVAIVGPTGAGKTTLVNLLMKFYKIKDGDIKIDGVSIHELKRGNVARLFGMVLQDTWLFEGTIRNNLLYNVEVPKEREQELLDNAARATGIDHFIGTLPLGYETVLDERAKISDGQRQLFTIARAMIKDAPLLILDEATSSVDTRTEVLIQDAMDKLTQGRTSFVIAHRLSTIKNADVILVMNHGDIVENGTHDELLKKDGFYAELYNSQFVE